MLNNKINPFDVLSGKVIKNHIGTFWFKEAGNNMQDNGWPMFANLHREDGPAVEWIAGGKEWWIDGYLRPPQ